MNQEIIRFGTDGWRGIIAGDFTWHNVARVGEGLVKLLLNETPKKRNVSPSVVIGYDSRFRAKDFAYLFARVLSRRDITVIFSSSPLPTPLISLAVREKKVSLGIMFTASHNPPVFQGLKIKLPPGYSAPLEFTQRLEKYIPDSVSDIPFSDEPDKETGLKEENFFPLYRKYLEKQVNLGRIRPILGKVVFDSLYGVAGGLLPYLLGKRVNIIHSRLDPLFGGLNPEPIPPNINELRTMLCRQKDKIGLVFDGDADRLGVLEEGGGYLPPHLVFPLLLFYLVGEKGWRGKVVQTISLGYLSKRIAADYNLSWEEVPVGYKYIAARMLKEPVLLGGEESGGYGSGRGIPERDGLLSGLLLLEMCASQGKLLRLLRQNLEKKYGKSSFLRVDLSYAGEVLTKEDFTSRILKRIGSVLAGEQIRQVDSFDGIRLTFTDNSWLLLRPSGTEPLVRIYSETPAISRTRKFLSAGQKLIESVCKP